MLDQSQPKLCKHDFRYSTFEAPEAWRPLGAKDFHCKLCVKCGEAYRNNEACCPYHAEEWDRVEDAPPELVRMAEEKWPTMKQMQDAVEFAEVAPDAPILQ